MIGDIIQYKGYRLIDTGLRNRTYKDLMQGFDLAIKTLIVRSIVPLRDEPHIRFPRGVIFEQECFVKLGSFNWEPYSILLTHRTGRINSKYFPFIDSLRRFRII